MGFIGPLCKYVIIFLDPSTQGMKKLRYAVQKIIIIIIIIIITPGSKDPRG